ncbi:hypothetical protein ACW6QP_01375 [Salegentibacter sp. HM20]
MKEKIQAELKNLASEIQKGDFNTEDLKIKALKLFEKLSLLSYTEKFMAEETKEIKAEVEPTPVETESAPKPAASEIKKEESQSFGFDDFPDGTQYRDEEAITEPATEKIKDIVAQMPPETQKVDQLFDDIEEPVKPKAEQKPAAKPAPKPQQPPAPKNDFRNIGVDYDNLPNFEPLNNRQKENRPKSVNDRLKKGINIGLNERLSFIKHLFDGNAADYNRVLSQLNTIDSLEEAKKFIEKIVKPDYNHWEGKEVYEERFLERISNKYE